LVIKDKMIENLSI